MFQALTKVEAAHLRVAFTEPQRWSAFAVSRVCAPCLGAQKTKLPSPLPLNHNSGLRLCAVSWLTVFSLWSSWYFVTTPLWPSQVVAEEKAAASASASAHHVCAACVGSLRLRSATSVRERKVYNHIWHSLQQHLLKRTLDHASLPFMEWRFWFFAVAFHIAVWKVFGGLNLRGSRNRCIKFSGKS